MFFIFIFIFTHCYLTASYTLETTTSPVGIYVTPQDKLIITALSQCSNIHNLLDLIEQYSLEENNLFTENNNWWGNYCAMLHLIDLHIKYEYISFPVPPTKALLFHLLNPFNDDFS